MTNLLFVPKEMTMIRMVLEAKLAQKHGEELANMGNVKEIAMADDMFVVQIDGELDRAVAKLTVDIMQDITVRFQTCYNHIVEGYMDIQDKKIVLESLELASQIQTDDLSPELKQLVHEKELLAQEIIRKVNNYVRE